MVVVVEVLLWMLAPLTIAAVIVGVLWGPELYRAWKHGRK